MMNRKSLLSTLFDLWLVTLVYSSKSYGDSQSMNGTPVMDIAAPNEHGLSHNRVADFNVEDSGLVFNNENIKQGSRTYIGGIISKNPNLAHDSARHILIEVNGKTVSSINGPMEIGGKRADLTIANKYGISTNGHQVVYNARNVTYSTGESRNAGRTNWDLIVTQGDLKLRGFLDTGAPSPPSNEVFDENNGALEVLKPMSSIRFVARSIDNKMDIGRDPTKAKGKNKQADIYFIAGSHRYQVQSGEVSELTDHEDIVKASRHESYGIKGDKDQSMYGDLVTFEVTEAGVGVHHPGFIQSMNLSIKAHGKVKLDGHMFRIDGDVEIIGDTVQLGSKSTRPRLTLNEERKLPFNSDLPHLKARTNLVKKSAGSEDLLFVEKLNHSNGYNENRPVDLPQVSFRDRRPLPTLNDVIKIPRNNEYAMKIPRNNEAFWVVGDLKISSRKNEIRLDDDISAKGMIRIVSAGSLNVDNAKLDAERIHIDVVSKVNISSEGQLNARGDLTEGHSKEDVLVIKSDSLLNNGRIFSNGDANYDVINFHNETGGVYSSGTLEISADSYKNSNRDYLLSDNNYKPSIFSLGSSTLRVYKCCKSTEYLPVSDTKTLVRVSEDFRFETKGGLRQLGSIEFISKHGDITLLAPVVSSKGITLKAEWGDIEFFDLVTSGKDDLIMIAEAFRNHKGSILLAAGSLSALGVRFINESGGIIAIGKNFILDVNEFYNATEVGIPKLLRVVPQNNISYPWVDRGTIKVHIRSLFSSRSQTVEDYRTIFKIQTAQEQLPQIKLPGGLPPGKISVKGNLHFNQRKRLNNAKFRNEGIIYVDGDIKIHGGIVNQTIYPKYDILKILKEKKLYLVRITHFGIRGQQSSFERWPWDTLLTFDSLADRHGEQSEGG